MSNSLTHPWNSHKGLNGAKPLFTPEEMETRVREWVASYEEDGYNYRKVPAITALAFHLGVTRFTIYNYRKKEEYREIIDLAYTFCEMHNEQKMYDPSVRPAGPIFIAKVQFGWRDGSEKGINVNFNWNAVQAEAEKKRKELESGYGGDPDAVDV